MLTIVRMTKNEAINLFGAPKDLADALSITRHAVYQWPDDLPQATIDRVTGAAHRLKKIKQEGESAA